LWAPVLERLSKTLARRQADRDDAINRAAASSSRALEWIWPASCSAGCGASSGYRQRPGGARL